MKVFHFFFLLFCIKICYSQTPSYPKDSVSKVIKNLPDITIFGINNNSEIQQLPQIVGTEIYAGKKSTLIIVDKIQGNTVSNTMRQILSKVPGIHVWESDPSGIQIGIAARGLSPNRSWEFNVRQNGYDISADPFGYPEAYYNPPMQGVDRIELVRGHASLQYGPQFGGMINYNLKNGNDINKPLQYESEQTIGSNGLFNSYIAVGGKNKNIHYYNFINHRNGDGWRQNSKYHINNGFSTFTVHFSDKVWLTAEIMLSHMNSQQPGGLTDIEYLDDAKQSKRSRNWMDIKWATPAFTLNYFINKNCRWNTKVYTIAGNRNSVGFLQTINISDTINNATGNFSNRTLQAEKYRNFGVESRFITDYRLGEKINTLSAGIRYFKGNTSRRANGKGTTNTFYEMALKGQYLQDLNFDSENYAVFSETILRLNKRLSLIPGVRYESVSGKATGRASFLSNGDEIKIVPYYKTKQFALGGIGAEYKLSKSTDFYTNISKAYRPVLFSNLQANPTTDSTDKNITDASGYNFDAGFRGKIKNLIQFDVSVFCLNYKNKIGTISGLANGKRLITNVGNSFNKGIESYVEFFPIKLFNLKKAVYATIFSSYSFTEAKYSNSHKDSSVKGKYVENAPKNILRYGFSIDYSDFLFTLQQNYVDKTFSDANNTILPTVNAQNGLIPSYTIMDCILQFNPDSRINFKAGINNVMNKKYFTRRHSGYPGPGLLPADGRTSFISIGLKW